MPSKSEADEERERPPEDDGSETRGPPFSLDPNDQPEDGRIGDDPVGAGCVVSPKQNAPAASADRPVEDEAASGGNLRRDDGADRDRGAAGRGDRHDVSIPERGAHARSPHGQRHRHPSRRQLGEEPGRHRARNAHRAGCRWHGTSRKRLHEIDASTACDSLPAMPGRPLEPRSIGASPRGLELTAELDWALSRAFGRPAPGRARGFEGGEAVSLAGRLGLLPRIVHLLGPASLAAELGEAAARDALAEYRESALASARLVALARLVGRAAGRSSVRVVALKHVALCLSGASDAAARGAADADILVADADAPRLIRELRRARVFETGAPSYDHQHSPLVHAQGGMLELHRTLPGVRPSPGAPELRLEPLVALGFAECPDAAAPSLLVPRPHVLLAHALAHGLYQHGLAPGAYPAFKLLADTADLRRSAGAQVIRDALPLVAAEVDENDARAAWELPSLLATEGAARVLARDPAPEARLLAHFLFGALEPGYGDALKLRSAATLPSDRGGVAGLLRWAWHTIAISPAQAQSLYGADTRARYLLALVRRPFHLAAKLVRYVGAASRGRAPRH